MDRWFLVRKQRWRFFSSLDTHFSFCWWPANYFTAQFVISKRNKCAWLQTPGRKGLVKPARTSPRTNLSMPTIGESSVISNVDYDDDDMEDEMDIEEFPLKRPLRTRSCRFPSKVTAKHSNSSSLRKPPLRMTSNEGWHLLSLSKETYSRECSPNTLT